MRFAVPLILAVAVTLTRCSAEPAPDAAVDTAPGVPFGVPQETVAPPSQRPTSVPQVDEEMYGPRIELPGGILKKQIGKVAQWAGQGEEDMNKWSFRLIVDSIQLNPKCVDYVQTPERGHRLVVFVRVETSQFYDFLRDGVPYSSAWSTIGPDGVTEPPTTSNDCHPAKAFPQQMRPVAKYRGEVTVDTSNPTGQLVLADSFAWDYPVSTG